MSNNIQDYHELDLPPPSLDEKHDDDYQNMSRENEEKGCIGYLKSDRFVYHGICFGIVTAFIYMCILVTAIL